VATGEARVGSAGAAAVVTPFEFPAIEGVVVGDLDGNAAMPTARELEALHKQAWAEGYESGRAEGQAAGEKRAAELVRERLARLDGILHELGAPLATLDAELVEAVAELALLIARHLVRRELKAAPGEVVGVVRETMRHLPLASRGIMLRLNPEDVDLVRSALGLGDDVTAWRLEPDPLITRGGCLVESASSRIDATVESRLAAIASRMFGGEREGDREA
jgi:flagellar assembly protein FliH